MMFWYGSTWSWWEVTLMWLGMIAFWALVVWAIYAFVSGAVVVPGFGSPSCGGRPRPASRERLRRHAAGPHRTAATRARSSPRTPPISHQYNHSDEGSRSLPSSSQTFSGIASDASSSVSSIRSARVMPIAVEEMLGLRNENWMAAALRGTPAREQTAPISRMRSRATEVSSLYAYFGICSTPLRGPRLP